MKVARRLGVEKTISGSLGKHGFQVHCAYVDKKAMQRTDTEPAIYAVVEWWLKNWLEVRQEGLSVHYTRTFCYLSLEH